MSCGNYTGPAAAHLVTSPSSVLRTNRNFRLLFFGQAISQLGDWFNSVAVFALLLDLTGSATAVAWMMIVQFLPMAIVGPLAGVVVDRVDRRRLMIAADLFRGVMILGLLLVHRREQVWIAYVVTAVCVSAQAFFEPARTATIPNITSADELMPANALSSATWSAMLARRRIDRRAGDGAVGTKRRVHPQRRFVLRLRDPHQPDALRLDAAQPARRARVSPTMTGVPDLLEGLRYVRARSHVAALMFVKAGWGLAGGVLLLLTIFGQRIFPVGTTSAGGIGILYGARGSARASVRSRCAGFSVRTPKTLRRTHRAGVLHRRRFLRAAGGRAVAAAGRALRPVRAFRRVDPVGIQHRPAADGSAGPISRPGVCGRARARHARPRRSRATSPPSRSTAADGRPGRWRLRSARCFVFPDSSGW